MRLPSLLTYLERRQSLVYELHVSEFLVHTIMANKGAGRTRLPLRSGLRNRLFGKKEEQKELSVKERAVEVVQRAITVVQCFNGPSNVTNRSNLNTLLDQAMVSNSYLFRPHMVTN
jgi:hypothetical protein